MYSYGAKMLCTTQVSNFAAQRSASGWANTVAAAVSRTNLKCLRNLQLLEVQGNVLPLDHAHVRGHHPAF